jgi:hypothetical protein
MYVRTRVLFLAVAATVALAVSSQITIGTFDTANGAPFGGLPYQDRYQQLYQPWAFPEHPENIKRISFHSDPTRGTGQTTLNVTIRMATATSPSPVDIFDANLGSDLKVVYNGPITADLDGSFGDLAFNLTKPFLYNPTKGLPLIIDIQVYSFSGFTGSFKFGADSRTSRVYRSAADGHIVVELGVGLVTTFDVTP